MIKERQFREAGWVYLMAICLAKTAVNHSSITEAVQWLEENGFDRKARKLIQKQEHNLSEHRDTKYKAQRP